MPNNFDYTEDHLAIEAYSWFRMQYPHKIFHHSAGERGAVRINSKGQRYSPKGQKLKRMGQQAGWPDVSILEPAGDYHGLFIELKSTYESGKNYPGEKQRELLYDLGRRGYAVAVAWTLDEFRTYCNQYFSQGEVDCGYMKGLFKRESKKRTEKIGYARFEKPRH